MDGYNGNVVFGTIALVNERDLSLSLFVSLSFSLALFLEQTNKRTVLFEGLVPIWTRPYISYQSPLDSSLVEDIGRA